MLTLEELRRMVVENETGERVPTPKGLRESGVPVVASKVVDGNTDVTVYQNGMVLYQADGHVTVFALHDCESYSYASQIGAQYLISSDYFEKEQWYVRLLLEGEDRIALNGEKIAQARSISYNVTGDGWLTEPDSAQNPLERIVEQEYIQELLGMMTESQRRAVSRCFLDMEPQIEVALELGISPQAVSDLIVNGVCRVRRQYGIKDRRLKKGKAKQNK
ncbi:MAG: sigma-70 family RNA polymerase sigma factor [Lachnospiraceae bacterium]|nr:sigma-70 family RNA polymerase sigma factor [Lachnospiraceae bacterium]